MKKILRADLIVIAVLSLLWLVPLAVIGVAGEFSLNDDWAYSRAAKRLMEIGQIERVAWTWIPAITHSWFGYLFATVLDVSFLEAVRWVGIVFGWLAMIGCYTLCRVVGAQALASGFAAATLAFNPVFLNLAFTYMTDVPFSAFIVWSLVAYCIGARRRSVAWLALGSALALTATLTRQTGMALPMTLAIAIVLVAPLEVRNWLTAVGINAVVYAGVVLGSKFAYGPHDAGMMFTAESLQIAVGGSSAAYHLVKNSLAQLSYLGCFVAPVVLLCVRFPTKLRTGAWIATVAFVAGCLGLVARMRLEMPPGINVIYNLGLGRRMLSDPPVLPATGEWIWWILVGLGFGIAALGLLACLLGALPRIRELRTRPDLLVCMGFPIVFLGPHLIRAPCFDRYLLPVFAAVVAALLVLPDWSGVPRRSRVVAASLTLAVLAAFSVVGTRDYMEHHRARAALLDSLLEQGVDSARIDGGFEFNGLHSLTRIPGVKPARQWVYVNTDEYIVTDLERVDGYELVSSNSFERLMPPGRETIRVMRRSP